VWLHISATLQIQLKDLCVQHQCSLFCLITFTLAICRGFLVNFLFGSVMQSTMLATSPLVGIR